MKFYVADIDPSGNDFYIINGAYISSNVIESYNNVGNVNDISNLNNFDYNNVHIDDLVGLYYAFEDTHAFRAALKKIMHTEINLRAICLIMESRRLTIHMGIQHDLDLIRSKLTFLGLDYISEKTYLLSHLAQYRTLIKAYVDQVHTICITKQIHDFITREIFSRNIPQWFETLDYKLFNCSSKVDEYDNLFDDISSDPEEQY